MRFAPFSFFFFFFVWNFGLNRPVRHQYRCVSVVSPDTDRVGANRPDSAQIGPSLC